MLSRDQLSDLWMLLRRRAARIGIVASFVVVALISGCGPAPNTCTNCGFRSGQSVLVQFPDGSYRVINADQGGCGSVTTTANCNQVGWAGL